MATLLHIVSYGAAVVVFIFATLSLANGLLWIAEVIEEHSTTAKLVGKRTVYAVITFHVLLYFAEPTLPLMHMSFSICCHFVYLQNFRDFPVISLTSWHLIASCLLVVIDHFLWVFHFREITEAAQRRERRWSYPMEPAPHVPTFLDIATFFGICVWLVPLFLFLSLSANDNALPITRHESSVSIASHRNDSPVNTQRSSLFVSLSSKALSFLPTRVSRGRSHRTPDTIIAPRSTSPTPLLSGPSPNFQRRPTSPIISSSSLTRSGPLPGNAAASFPSTNYSTGSWVSIETELGPPSGNSARSALDGLMNENPSARRRTNVHGSAQANT